MRSASARYRFGLAAVRYCIRRHIHQRGLNGIVAEPSAFLRKEQATKDDEAHARQMLDMLPRAFVFDNMRLADGVWRMDFHPDPNYSPSGLQEHVLHGMSGGRRD